MSQQDPEEAIWTTFLTRGVDEPQPLTPRNAKRYCLIGLVVLSVFCGAIDPFMVEDSSIERILGRVVGLSIAVLIFLWCHYDSQKRCCRFGLAMRVLIVVTSIVGVPVCLLSTRGLRGMVSIAWMALCFAACLLSAYLTMEAMQLVVG